MANTLKFGNGTWATKEGSALAYNDENGNYKPLPFNFDRASSATRVNKEGLIEVVGRDKPRIDYTDSAEGALLLEPQRTNSILYSNGFGNSAWEKGATGTASSPVVTSNQGISPDKTNNAFKIDFNLGGGTTSSDRSRLTENFTGTSSTEYVFTFYAKAYSASDVGKIVNFSVDNVSNEDANFTLTSEWQRFTFSGTSTGTFINQHIQLRGNLNTSDTASMLLFGYQAEAGSHPTSYIPTQGSAVTRVADVCDNGGNDQVINSTEGVLYAEIAALTDTSDASKFIAISDGSYNNRASILFSNGATNQIRTFLRVGGVPQIDVSANVTDVTDFNKVAFSYKENDFKVYINGSLVSSDTSGSVWSENTITKLSFSEINTSAGLFNGKAKCVAVFKEALSDEELQALTRI